MPDNPFVVVVVAAGFSLRQGIYNRLAGTSVEIQKEAASLDELRELPPRLDALLLAGAAVKQPWTRPPVPALLLSAEAIPFARLPWRPWALLTADASSDEILSALGALRSGLCVAVPQWLAANHSAQNNPDEPWEALTRREMEILQYLAQGLPNKQIARALEISENTIKFHIAAIYSKLGASSRTEAVRLGAQRGWVTF